jgi:hypothetical protein
MNSKTSFVRNRFGWIKILESMSQVVARFDLTHNVNDEVYKADGQAAINKDAFNFANSREHSTVIADTIEKLAARGVPDDLLRKFVVDLTGRNIYGSFCELAAYAFLLSGNHDFDAQVNVTGTDILNPNGSDLDGVVRLYDQETTFFDAKAFGFTEHLVDRLRARLSEDFQPRHVQAEGSFDVPIQLLEDLLGRGYAALTRELNASAKATRGTIEFSLKPPARIHVAHRTESASALAAKNADYVFRFAKQFVRHQPVFLFFIIHPWVSTLRFHENFGEQVDAFTRAFAAQSFTRFRSDQTPTFDVTRGIASDLLTGIVFVDAWQGAPTPQPPRYRCYINPHAANRLTDLAIQAFAAPYGQNMSVVRL